MTCIDLFCGAGGLSAGLLDSGVDVILGVDIDRLALRVYGKNLGVEAACLDLSAPPPLPRVDLIAAGPPCQDFSSAGRRCEGIRADLTMTFARIVARQEPTYCLYENVALARRSPVYLGAKKRLSECGYHLAEAVLDASRYGVPQRRLRLVLVGVRGGRVEADDLASGASPPVTPKRYCDSVGMPLAPKHYYVQPRCNNSKAVWSISEVAPTIRAACKLPVPPDYAGYGTDSTSDLRGVRPLTLREASLIQTFPASWDWCDINLADAWQMLANAVPPVLAQHMGGFFPSDDMIDPGET